MPKIVDVVHRFTLGDGWSATLGYTHALAAGVTLDLHADTSYRSDVTTQVNSTDSDYQQLGGRRAGSR